MLYPVYVHMGNNTTAHGVTFPDFEGCFAAADDWAALPTAIQEAVEAHFFGEYSPIPAPTPLEQLTDNPEHQGGKWLLADIDLSRINSKPIRLNMSNPSKTIDAQTTQLMRDLEQGLQEAHTGTYAQVHTPDVIAKRKTVRYKQSELPPQTE